MNFPCPNPLASRVQGPGCFRTWWLGSKGRMGARSCAYRVPPKEKPLCSCGSWSCINLSLAFAQWVRAETRLGFSKLFANTPTPWKGTVQLSPEDSRIQAGGFGGQVSVLWLGTQRCSPCWHHLPLCSWFSCLEKGNCQTSP